MMLERNSQRLKWGATARGFHVHGRVQGHVHGNVHGLVRGGARDCTCTTPGAGDSRERITTPTLRFIFGRFDPRNRNLAFRVRNLASWLRNLAFPGRRSP